MSMISLTHGYILLYGQVKLCMLLVNYMTTDIISVSGWLVWLYTSMVAAMSMAAITGSMQIHCLRFPVTHYVAAKHLGEILLVAILIV